MSTNQPTNRRDPARISSPLAQLVAVFVLAVGLVTAAPGLAQPPPGDFGDAPVGNNGDNIYAYPGVLARWVSWYQHRNTVTVPVQHLQGTWLHTGASFRLGQIPPNSTADTQQLPGLPENDAAPVIVLEALGSNPLAQLKVQVSTDLGHVASQAFYLNVFVDQDRTGEWKDGWNLGSPVAAWDLEWVAQDVPVLMPADEVRDLNLGFIRLKAPTQPVWLRLIVSDAPIGTILKSGEPFWDATMTASHGWSGEIEDHYLEYQTTFLPGQKGIYPWWVYGRGSGGGGGGGNPKPACDAFYVGPKVLLTPWCKDGWVNFNTIYRVTERNNGCDPDLLYGMYGLKHLSGVFDPPTVLLQNAAFFVGGTLGSNTLNCPDGTVLTLPAAVEGFPPMFQGHVTDTNLRGGVAPTAFKACYPNPKRFRAYRAFLEVMTCGSVHQSVSVQTGPAVAHAPSAIEAIGRRVDHVDFMAGELEEDFVDPDWGRPFPDPDFADYAITVVSPTGLGGLDEDDFVSAPSSLHLKGALYWVRPQIPGEGLPVRMTGVQFQYRTVPGTEGTVTITSTFGDQIVSTLADAPAWADFVITLPPEFDLGDITFEMTDGWLDDLVVNLAEFTDCNQNGMDDTIDLYVGTSTDLDGNSIPDECDLANPCEGYCGTRSPDGCWCDEQCVEFGDCCEGADLTCAADLSAVADGLPTRLGIADAMPNPFNPMTTIRFELPTAGDVTVAVYDVRGGLVRTLWNGTREAGRHLVQWNGRDDSGRSVPSGVYLARVVTAEGAWQSVKITLAR